MLGHITYLSREAMTQKFGAQRLQPRDVQTQFETKFAVGSYLAYQGDRFGERFDANSYLTLTMAIDLFDLGDTPEKLQAVLGQSNCRWLLMSFTSDWLFPPFQSQEIVDSLIASHKPVSYCNVQSDCGHDAFLLPDQLDVYGELIRAFLANLDGNGGEQSGTEMTKSENGAAAAEDGSRKRGSARKPEAIVAHPTPRVSRPASPAHTSIFQHNRLDYRNDSGTDPAGGQRVGPGLRHGRTAWPGSAPAATSDSWASNGTSRPLWPAFAAGWTWSRPT